MAKVLVIKEDLVKQLVSLNDTIPLVEQAYTDHCENRGKIFPAVREMIEEHNGIFGIKSSYLEANHVIGLKAGGFWAGNIARRKTNHQSTMLLFDPETGEPTCLLDANYLTGIRTGAAGAVAAKYLARKDSKVVGLIGTGIQARTQLQGIIEAFPIEQIVVYNRNIDSAKEFLKEIEKCGIKASFTDSAQNVAEVADIIITTTPSFSAIVKTSWVKPGTHINAIGSDTKGKRELEIDNDSVKLICDVWEQSSIMGELQHGVKRGELYAEIGEITSGRKRGRENDQEITIFDSTGIALQDLIVASFVYQEAKAKGLGVMVDL